MAEFGNLPASEAAGVLQGLIEQGLISPQPQYPLAPEKAWGAIPEWAHGAPSTQTQIAPPIGPAQVGAQAPLPLSPGMPSTITPLGMAPSAPSGPPQMGELGGPGGQSGGFNPEMVLQQLMGMIANQPAPSPLQLLAASWSGKTSPWEIVAQHRQQQLQGLIHGAQFGMSALKLRNEEKSQSFRQAQIQAETARDILRTKDASPALKEWAAKNYIQGLQGMGMKVSSEDASRFAVTGLNSETMKEAAQMLIGGFTPEQASTALKLPLSQVKTIEQGLRSDDTRKALGLPTLEDLKLGAFKTQEAELDIATKKLGLQDPKLGEVARQFSLTLFGKRLESLSEPQQQIVATKALAWQLEEAGLKGGIQPTDQSARDWIIGFETSLQNLEGAKALLDSGAADKFIGPWTASPGAALGRLAETKAPEWFLGRQADPSFVNLKIFINNLRNTLLRAYGGKALTESELKLAQDVNPVIEDDKKEIFKAKVAFQMETVRVALARMKELAGVGGRAALDPDYKAGVFLRNRLPAIPEALKAKPEKPGETYWQDPKLPNTDPKKIMKVGPGEPPPAGYIEIK